MSCATEGHIEDIVLAIVGHYVLLTTIMSCPTEGHIEDICRVENRRELREEKKRQKRRNVVTPILQCAKRVEYISMCLVLIRR